MAWMMLLLPFVFAAGTQLQDDLQFMQIATTVQTAQPAIASFLSNDKNVCFEGPAGLAESALATKRVSPYSAMLNAATIRSGVYCKDEGYKLTVGEDDCYPGLHVFKKWELGMLTYRMSKRMVLNGYAKRYGLNNSIVELMVGCTCHADSELRGLRKGECSKLETIPASWVRRDPHTNELTCEQGHYESASRAAAVLNSMPHLPSYLSDQVHPADCKAMGYPTKEKSADYASFLSNDGHVCFEALAPIATHALSLKQATPYNLVFDGSVVKLNQRCETQGFNTTIGRDDCYPGLHVFAKSQDTMLMYKLHKHNVMTQYSKFYKLPYSQVELMNACVCHPKSNLRLQRLGECGSLDQKSVSWVHAHPQKSGELSCDQGPFESMTRAVVLLKNTLPEPLMLNLSKNERMAPVSCKEHLSQKVIQ